MRERPKAQKPRAPADRALEHAPIAATRVRGRASKLDPLQRDHTVMRALLNGPVKLFFGALIRAGTTEITLTLDKKTIGIRIEDSNRG